MNPPWLEGFFFRLPIEQEFGTAIYPPASFSPALVGNATKWCSLSARNSACGHQLAGITAVFTLAQGLLPK
jgi:hypothetical protein